MHTIVSSGNSYFAAGFIVHLRGHTSLTPPTFSFSFPGMVHFVLIDRSFDELTTPSLSIDNHVVREQLHIASNTVLAYSVWEREASSCRDTECDTSLRVFTMWRGWQRNQKKVLVSFCEEK